MDFRCQGDALTAYVTFRDAYALDMAVLLSVSPYLFPIENDLLPGIDFNVFRELRSLIKLFRYPCTVSTITNLTISLKKKIMIL